MNPKDRPSDRTINYFEFRNNFEDNKNIDSQLIFSNKLQLIPQYTIAIPTYKRPAYLKEAIESVLAQKGSIPIEIIVLDNNPERDDDTEKLMQKYRKRDGVSYYKNVENIGMVGNFNRIYELARTEIVIALHDDDYLLPGYLEYHNYIINNIISDWDIILPSYYKSNSKPYTNEVKYLYKLRLSHFAYYNPIGLPTAIITKRQSILKSGGWRKRMYPTIFLDLYLRMLNDGKQIYKVISNPTCVYRIEVNESLRIETINNFLKDRADMDFVLNNRLNIVSRHFQKQRQKYFYPDILNYHIRFTNNKYKEIQQKYEKSLKIRNWYNKFIFKIFDRIEKRRIKSDRILVVRK